MRKKRKTLGQLRNELRQDVQDWAQRNMVYPKDLLDPPVPRSQWFKAQYLPKKREEAMTDYPPPGPKLDALVAEKVMGLKAKIEYGHAVIQDPETFGSDEWFCCSPYSHCISAAWEVVERFVSHGCAAWVEGDGHTGYRAGCTSQDGRFEAEGDTAPHAICLAALKVVEEK